MTDQEIFQKCDNLERRIKQLEAVVGKIEAENEPEFQITHDEKYYFVDFHSRGCNLFVTSDVYVGALGDKLRVEQNNCFKTKERAEEVFDKINLLLKLERLHDIYCPNYKPNWGCDFVKHYVCYDTSEEKWCSRYVEAIEDAIQVYFPTKEIAQKVCDILNKENRFV